MAKTTGPIQRRRRASDLYSLGRPLELDDGALDYVVRMENGEIVMENGEPVVDEVLLPPVTLWVAKLSDLEMGEAFKHAARAQSVAMAAARDPESEQYTNMAASVAGMERDSLIDILVDRDYPELESWDDSGAVPEKYAAVEARVHGEPDIDTETGDEIPNEWAKEDYLEGLREAWWGGLDRAYAADPNDYEAKRTLDEITRFNDEVEHEYGEARKDARAELDQFTDTRLVDDVVDLLASIDGQAAWQEEYQVRVVFLATRNCDGPDPDDPTHRRCKCRGTGRKHADFHFQSIDEVRSTDGRVRIPIYLAWNQLMVSPREGKGLRAIRASSLAPASPATEEVTETSGPGDASE